MTLFLDLTTNRFVAGLYNASTVRSFSFKRGDAASISLYLLNNGVVVNPSDLTTPLQIKFAIKADGDYDGTPLVIASEYSVATNGAVLFSPNFNTNELNTAIGELPYIRGMLEITISGDSGSTWTSSDTAIAIVHNDVIKDTDGVPTPAENQTFAEAMGLNLPSVMKSFTSHKVFGNGNLYDNQWSTEGIIIGNYNSVNGDTISSSIILGTGNSENGAGNNIIIGRNINASGNGSVYISSGLLASPSTNYPIGYIGTNTNAFACSEGGFGSIIPLRSIGRPMENGTIFNPVAGDVASWNGGTIPTNHCSIVFDPSSEMIEFWICGDDGLPYKAQLQAAGVEA